MNINTWLRRVGRFKRQRSWTALRCVWHTTPTGSWALEWWPWTTSWRTHPLWRYAECSCGSGARTESALQARGSSWIRTSLSKSHIILLCCSKYIDTMSSFIKGQNKYTIQLAKTTLKTLSKAKTLTESYLDIAYPLLMDKNNLGPKLWGWSNWCD